MDWSTELRCCWRRLVSGCAFEAAGHVTYDYPSQRAGSPSRPAVHLSVAYPCHCRPVLSSSCGYSVNHGGQVALPCHAMPRRALLHVAVEAAPTVCCKTLGYLQSTERSGFLNQISICRAIPRLLIPGSALIYDLVPTSEQQRRASRVKPRWSRDSISPGEGKGEGGGVIGQHCICD